MPCPLGDVLRRARRHLHQTIGRAGDLTAGFEGAFLPRDRTDDSGLDFQVRSGDSSECPLSADRLGSNGRLRLKCAAVHPAMCRGHLFCARARRWGRAPASGSLFSPHITEDREWRLRARRWRGVAPRGSISGRSEPRGGQCATGVGGCCSQALRVRAGRNSWWIALLRAYGGFAASPAAACGFCSTALPVPTGESCPD